MEDMEEEDTRVQGAGSEANAERDRFCAAGQGVFCFLTDGVPVEGHSGIRPGETGEGAKAA
jgi:hypothetical protein